MPSGSQSLADLLSFSLGYHDLTWCSSFLKTFSYKSVMKWLETSSQCLGFWPWAPLNPIDERHTASLVVDVVVQPHLVVQLLADLLLRLRLVSDNINCSHGFDITIVVFAIIIITVIANISINGNLHNDNHFFYRSDQLLPGWACYQPCLKSFSLYFSFFMITWPYAALRAADLDWIVGPGHS